MEDRDIEQYTSDIVTGRPHVFSVGGNVFYIYPATLGKLFLLDRSMKELGISGANMQLDMRIEALRVAREKRRECATLISIFTLERREEVFDHTVVSERCELFCKELSDEDMASLLIVILTLDRTAAVMKHLGIDREQERMKKVMRIKERSQSGCLSFGGVSIFGTFIDAACERYGWTKEYVVWEIDYASLKLMMADKMTSVSVTEDEMKKIPSNMKESASNTVIATKENMERIKAMGWK